MPPTEKKRVFNSPLQKTLSSVTPTADLISKYAT